jgi:Family of unknown function (DUF6325)
MGPLEYAVFRFQGNEFNGEILPALGRLVDSGTIAVLDLLFITKDGDGKASWVELQDLPGDGEGLMAVTGGQRSLLSEEDAQFVADDMPPNCSAALLVWEDKWAEELVNAIQASGGEAVAVERIPKSIVDAALAAEATGA